MNKYWKNVKYKVERSHYPEGNMTHLVFRYSVSRHGCNIKRVFKGTYKECVEKARELKCIQLISLKDAINLESKGE